MKQFIFFISLILICISPFFGQIDISLSNINNPEMMDHKLFWDLRFPRVIVAFFTGALLGLSGLLFQSIFRNPMSTPFTLGVASGATLGTAFAIVFGFVYYVAFFGFGGALLSIIILFALSSRLRSYDNSSLLLIGIALSFFYSASLMILFYLSDESQSYEIVRFTMGSLDVVGFGAVMPIAVSAFALLILSLLYKKDIKLLLTSYENAFLKGVDIKQVNYMLLFVISITIGIAVSITGPIGFVGLIVPHIIKSIYKKSADSLLVPTFFYSGVFLVLCDMVSRNMGSASDIPIGVITSFLGGPFFIYLLIRRKKSI
jgi:iron complex transport system permease protein